jgi:hypothetical protein
MYWRVETVAEEGRDQSRPFVFSRPKEDDMAQRRYRPADRIVLKQGVLGSSQPAGSGSVVSVLPAAQGFVHYRVRFENENFERSVRQDDIDVQASPSSLSPDATESYPQPSGSSWINSNSIRTNKKQLRS